MQHPILKPESCLPALVATELAPISQPLNPLEHAFFLLDRGARFNGVQIMTVRGPLSEQLVRPVLLRLQLRYPLLRVRIAGDDRAPLLTEQGAGPLPLRVLPRTGDLQWLQIAEDEMNRPFGYADDHLTRLTLLLGRDRTDVILAHHHVTGDALSIGYVMRDLLKDMAALTQGQPLPPVESLPLPPPLSTVLPREARGIHRYVAMNAFLGSHILMRPLRRARQLPIEQPAVPEARRMRMCHRALTGHDLATLRERARREGTSVHGALCAALLLATTQEVFAADLRAGRKMTLGCFSTINLRDKLVPTVGETMGNFISQVTTFHRVVPAPPLWELARAVKRELGQALRWGEHYVTLPMMGMLIPWGRNPASRFIRRFDGASPAALGLTNLAQLPIPRDYGPFSIEDYRLAVGTSVVGRLLGAVTSWGDRLNFNLIFVEPLIARARVERIIDGALDRLHLAALRAAA